MPHDSLTLPRRTFLQLSAGALPQATRAAAAPPNVLFFIIDDLNTDLGCFGARDVKTPNIDRLGARSVRFDRAYCQYPLCGPSRSSFLSGLRPETTGVMDQETVLRQKSPHTTLLPDFFRRNGYFTAGAGKVFHHAKPNLAGFDSFDPAETQDSGEREAVKRRYANPEGSRTPDWASLDSDDDRTADTILARGAISSLEKCAVNRKPFFLAAGFRKPHLPWAVPKKYFDLYPQVDPPNDPPMRGIPQAALETELGAMKPPQPKWQAIAAYRAATSYMDAQVGSVLAALDRLKLRENTIVVLFGDNGFHLGDHGLWSKHTLFERATRVPLLIAAPGAAPGATSPRLVELVDLFPTLAELTGLTPPAALDGKSLVPLLRRPNASWDKTARSTVRRSDVTGRSVRTERWRYNEWDEGRKGMELYDHAKDPGELINLATDRRHAGTREKMRRLLRNG